MERYTEASLLDASFEDAEPLLEGLISRGQNLLFVAPEKAAKTIFSLQLALCLAHGIPFLNWVPVGPSRVTYLAFEGTHYELQELVRRLRGGLGLTATTDDFVLRKAPFLHLTGKGGARDLFELLEKDHPALLVLDPLYRAHRGSVNDDGLMGETTAILNTASAKYGHATWLPHHEHRPRKDSYGFSEPDSEKYAGSWSLTAWASSIYGFSFRKKEKTAVFKAYSERVIHNEDPLSLHLKGGDDPSNKADLAFVFHGRTAVEDVLPRLEGMNQAKVAKYLGMHPETAHRALKDLEQKGRIKLVPKGREVVVKNVR